MLATDELKNEHEGIKLMLRVLEELASRAESGREVDTDDAAKTVEFFKVFADACHHGKEEDLLFPALVEAGIPSQGGPVGVMLHEHDQGRHYIRQMTLSLGGNGAGPDMAQFAQAARKYIELLSAHIGKENEVLFTMADQVLSPEKQAELKKGFDTLESERMGEGVHETFHAMMEDMAEKYLK